MKQLLLFILGFMLVHDLPAQKVGLVLSGGGAKGLAHIGVIKALEEHQIPIDYVSGTSMGAIIGGLYSSGYSPEEMEEIAVSQEFRNWANGEIEPDYSYYFKKKEPYPEFFSFKIEMEDSVPKAKIPTSLVPTELIDIQLLNLYTTAAAEAAYNFDILFRPFRCAATDITHNKTVIFKSGNLEKAIRASMTFPFYYKPIHSDSVVYFDGGIKNNFPYQVLIEDFNPDFLIGSKTAENAPTPESDDVVTQLQSMLLGQTDYSLPDSNGFLIDIKLDSTELFNFGKAQHIIDKGYRKTLQHIDSLLAVIPVRKSDSALQQERITYRQKLPELEFTQLQIEGVNRKQEKYIKGYFKQKMDQYTLNQFKDQYFKALSDENISSIYPTAMYDSSTSSFIMHLDIDQESKFVTSIGGNISSSSINQGFAKVQYNHLGKYSKNLTGNVYFGRLYSSAKISGRIDFPWNPEFYLKSAFTLNRWDYYNSTNDPFFEDVRPSYLIKNESFLRNEIGIPQGYHGKIRAGIDIGRSRAQYYLKERFLKSDTADRTYFYYYNPYLIYSRNTLNYKQYPTSGEFMRIKLDYARGSENYEPGNNTFFSEELQQNHAWIDLDIIYENYLPLTRGLKLGLRARGHFSNRSFFTNYYSTLLNAADYHPIPHSKSLFLKHFIGNHFVGLTLTPLYEFNDKIHLRASFSTFIPYQSIEASVTKEPMYSKPLRNYYKMGSASVVYQTIFGPTSLSVNYYDKESKKWYFLFNFGFILFNEPGLK